MALQPDLEVNEGSTGRLRFTIRDYDGAPVSSAVIASAEMTLKNDQDDTVINEHDGTDILSCIADTGVCTILLTADDNIIVDPLTVGTDELETHRMLISITTTGITTNTLNMEFLINVKNLKLIEVPEEE